MANYRQGVSSLGIGPAILLAAGVLWACAPPPDHRLGPALTFAPAVTLAAPIHPNTLAVADLDGDGDVEIAVPGFVEPTLYLHGDGGVSHAPLEAGVTELSAIDLDGDGPVELVATLGLVDRIEILGASADLSPFRVGALAVAAPSATTAVDLDGDGALDLAVTRFNPAAVTPFLRRGPGFVAGEATGLPAGAAAITSLRVGDRLLLAVVSSQTDQLVLVDPAAAPPWPVVAAAQTSAWPSAVVAADLDGDGTAELLGASNVGDTLFVARVSADRGGVALELDERELPGGPFGVTAADLDGDGDLDVAVALKSDDGVALFENDGTGRLTSAGELAVGAGPTPIVAVDVDRNGAIDLVTADAFSDTVSILYARPQPTR